MDSARRADVLDRYQQLAESFDEIARRRSSRRSAAPDTERPPSVAVRSFPIPFGIDGGRARKSGLSARELEVLKFVAVGARNKEIADVLGVSVETVKSHVKHVLGRLQAGTRAEAVAIAFCRRVLRPE